MSLWFSMFESCTVRYSSQFNHQCLAEMRSCSEEGSYFRFIDFCITRLLAESNKEEEEVQNVHVLRRLVAEGTTGLVAEWSRWGFGLRVERGEGSRPSRYPTLETTLGQMAPPKSGRVQESHLIQVAF